MAGAAQGGLESPSLGVAKEGQDVALSALGCGQGGDHSWV